MKKALMISSVPSMIGQFNMSNIQLLQNLEYEVHIACNFYDNSVWTTKRTEAFVMELRGKKVCYHQIDFPRNPLNMKKVFSSYRQLKRLVRNESFDLIHCHTPVAGVIGRLVAHKQKIKVIYTAHGFHFYKGAPLKNWLLYYPVEWLCSWWTDILVTINKEDYKRAKEKFHAVKTVYIPGVGVDTEKFAICKVDKEQKRKELGVKRDDFLLLSVGELSERKNQKVVIDALGRMNQEGSLGNIVYLLVGTGDAREKFANLVEEYGIKDHVKLIGFRTDIDKLCKTVNCFVHPSIREGLGIAPLEAMASGLPLISANMNGMKDYTENGISGCCVNPTSIDEMVIAIKKMRSDENFRYSCGLNNLEMAKYYDIKNANEIMSKVYRGITYKSH